MEKMHHRQSSPESASESISDDLKGAREEIRNFQAQESEGVRKSAHLIETETRPTVDIDQLTEQDLKIWLKKDTISSEEFRNYRDKVKKEDNYHREEFAAFVANIIQARMFKKELESKRDKS